MNNVQRLQTRLAKSGVPALLISDITNVQWLTGFTGSSGFVVLTPETGRFLTDSRYTIQAGEEVSDVPVRSYASPKKFTEFLRENVDELGVKTLAFEKSVTYGTWDEWRQALDGIDLTAAPEVLKPLRMVKTAEEVAKIKRACALADACLHHVVPRLQAGVTEFDIGLEIEFYFRRNGAEVGFSPIVASGPNSARPHAKPSERKFEPGDFITLDIGAKLDGYNSDITRTFVLGKATDRQKEVYSQVLKSQIASIGALRPGATGVGVDALARKILDEKGLAQYFGHGLGHGLGKAVHDLGGLNTRSEDAIEPGQVWTVEPGVYIEGFGGVRIEDDVLVTTGEPEVLTSYPKSLIELG
ncbi:MAG: aminopeptidase P family protein [Armatimonadetes bacterium]|nr:aminopeptidase P family protein [Armatimonadota bacterium]